MGLTKRQTEAIERIIIEESRGAAASQTERHRILSGLDERETVAETRGRVLSSGVVGALDDLIESVVSGNQVYEGVEFDRGIARVRAVRYLRGLIKADIREVQQMLHEGDFDSLDQQGVMMGMDQGYGMDDDLDQMGMPPGGMDQVDDDVELPPMHPRGREERKVSVKPGQVKTAGDPTGMKTTLPEPKAGGGYSGGSDDDVELPPMHPRGR